MPTDFDFLDFRTVTGNDRPKLDPISDMSDLGRLATQPQHIVDPSLADLGRLIRSDVRVDVTQPAPKTRAGLDLERQLLQNDRAFQEEMARQNPRTYGLAPSADRRIDYGELRGADETRHSPVTDTGAQIGLGILQAGAILRKQVGGVGELIGRERNYLAQSGAAALDATEKTGQEIGGLPGLRTLTSTAAAVAPVIAASALTGGGVGMAALGSGMLSAGAAYDDALEAKYEHADMYAIVQGIIEGGMTYIGGARGVEAAAKATTLAGATGFKKYVKDLVENFAGGKLLATHGGHEALEEGITSALQSAVDKWSINPNLTWADVAKQALVGAGLGAVLGEAAGTTQALSVDSMRKAPLTEAFKEFDANVEKTELESSLRPVERSAEVSPYQPQFRAEGNLTDLRENLTDSRALQARDREAQGQFEVGQAAAEAKAEQARKATPVRIASFDTVRGPAENLDDESSVYEVRERSGSSLRRPAIPLPAPVENPLAGVDAIELFETMSGKNQNKLISGKLPEPTDPAAQEYLRRVYEVPIEQTEKGIERKPVQISKAYQPPSQKLLPEVSQDTQAQRDAVIAEAKAKQAAELAVQLQKHKAEAQAAKKAAKVAKPKVEVSPSVVTAAPVVAPVVAPTTPAELSKQITALPEGKEINESMFSLVDPDSTPEEMQAAVAKLADISLKNPATGKLINAYLELQKQRTEARAKKEPTKEQDIARYQEVQKQLPELKFGSPEFIKAWGENEAIKNRHGGMPPKVEVPKTVEPVTKEPATKLPGKGEQITFGEFVVTRAQRGKNAGKVVLMATGGTEAEEQRVLAIMKGKTAAGVSERAIMEDLMASAREEKTKYWEFPARASSVKAATEKVLKPVKQEEAVTKLAETSNPLVKQALESGSLSPEILKVLVGDKTLTEGVKAVEEALQEELDVAVDNYVAGKLKVRWFEGTEQSDTPPELYKTKEEQTPTGQVETVKTGELYTQDEVLRDIYGGNEVAMQARVLNILVRNADAKIRKGEDERARRMGLGAPAQTDEGLTADPTEIRMSATTDTGTQMEERFEVADEELKTGGKIDPKKVAAMEQAGEIKASIFDTGDGDYDAAVKLLTQVVGWKPERAEAWMENPTSFLMPSAALPTAVVPDWLDKSTTLTEALNGVLEHGSTHQKALAQLLLAKQVQAQLRVVGNFWSQGQYFPEGSIIIRKHTNHDPLDILLHEAIHAYTVHVLEKPSTTSEWAFAATIKELYAETVDYLSELPVEELERFTTFDITYGLSNPHEFTAQLATLEFRALLNKIPSKVGTLTIWQRIKLAIRRLFGIQDNTVLDKAFTALYNLDVSAETKSKHTDGVFQYPDYRTKEQVLRATGYQEIPREEQEILTRKIIANNQWLLSPDIQQLLEGLPVKVQRILNSTISKRLDALSAGRQLPGAELSGDLQQVLSDPTINDERKSEIANSVLYNFLEFQKQVADINSRFVEARKKTVATIDKLNDGIEESNITVKAMDAALDDLIASFKTTVLNEREASKDDVRIEYLNRMVKLADEVKGNRRAAVSKLMENVAGKFDLNILLNETDPAEIQRQITAFLSDPGLAGDAHVSEETVRIASVIFGSSNSIREELLTLKLAKDDKVTTALFELESEHKTSWAKGDIEKLVNSFAKDTAKFANTRQQAMLLYRKLYKERARREQATLNLALANVVLERIQQTESYKGTWDLLVGNRGVLRPQVVPMPDNRLQFVHPLTGAPVDISLDFDREAEIKNITAMQELADAAKLYVIKTDAENYDPAVAAFWKQFIKNTAVLLDPTLSINARKLIPASYDPLNQLLKVGGHLTVIPDAVLRSVGGRAANDAQIGLQAYASVDGQLNNLKKQLDSSLSRTADDAASKHEMSHERWHNEVLTPLIASHQHTGYRPLGVGDKTLWGHKIVSEDMAAFRAQADFDRKVRAVAYEAKGNPAVGYNPAAVIFTDPQGGVLTRKPAATGATTMSRRLSRVADSLATSWFADTSVLGRRELLNVNFTSVVLGHLYTAGADNYVVKSPLTPLYKDVLRFIDKGGEVGDYDTLIDLLFEAQSKREDFPQRSKTELMKQLDTELTQVFNNVTGFKKSPPVYGTSAVLNVVTADNSFTQERGNLIAPATLYDYGATFDYQRIALLHSAKAFYALNLIGENGYLDRLHKAIVAKVGQYEAEAASVAKKNKVSIRKAEGAVDERSQAKQLNGDTLLTYTQARLAERQVGQLLDEMRRLFRSSTLAADPVTLQATQTAQNFLAANLLASPQAQTTNFFGGLANIALFDQLLGRSVWQGASNLGLRLVRDGFTEVAAIASKLGIVDKGLQKAISLPLVGELAETIYAMVEARKALHKQMELNGLTSTVNMSGDLAANWQMLTEGGRPQTDADLTRLKQAVLSIEATANLVTAPLAKVFPRWTDRFINIMAVQAARDLELSLMNRAIKFGEARAALGAPLDTWTDQELSETSGAGAGRAAELTRNLFRRVGLNVDQLMVDYYNDFKSGNARPSLFVEDGHRAGLQFSVAQDINLGTMATRPTATKGGRLRNLLGLFFGFPIWQVTRLSTLASRLSTDKTTAPYARHMLLAAITLAVAGALSTSVKKELVRLLFGEETGYKDLSQAKSAQEAGEILLNSTAQFIPFGGWVINNVILDNPNTTGFDINSQFVMLNFANDLAGTMRKVWQTGDASRPAMELTRRWSPLSRTVLNQLPANVGLTQYYNTARELRTLAPEGMEARRPGKQTFDYTPATPVLQDMVNSAYKGDVEGFQEAANAYIQMKIAGGFTIEDAEKSLQASWKSRHPYMRTFGKMPTEAEEALIFNNATDAQREDLVKANDVFSNYGSMIGAPVKPTREEKGSGGGSSISGLAARGSLRGGPVPALEPIISNVDMFGGSPVIPGIAKSMRVRKPRSSSGGSLRPTVHRAPKLSAPRIRKATSGSLRPRSAKKVSPTVRARQPRT